ncbi:hypothetical protein [Verminephrobacter eiseniae]|uniref:hypothetical protein n=1 Tax=Verminephrobacter eiseniae TaxID=364317 RepID=UPI00223715C2|nr:hypothetical protein [Verminephrobacter eiseniae]
MSCHRSDVVGCAQPSERSARRSARPIPSVLASDATPRCASMASADRQMIGDATLGLEPVSYRQGIEVIHGPPGTAMQNPDGERLTQEVLARFSMCFAQATRIRIPTRCSACAPRGWRSGWRRPTAAGRRVWTWC